MHNYVEYVGSLMLGLLFAIIGIGLLYAAFRAGKIFELLFSLPFILGGSLVTWITITSPLPWQRTNMAEVLLHSDPQQVTSIEIRPTTFQWHKQLTAAPVRITDAASIEKICQGLASAQPHSLNHPQSKWACILVLTAQNEKVHCEVADTSNNGLTIRLFSGETVITYCSTFRADALAEILTEVVSSTLPLEDRK